MSDSPDSYQLVDYSEKSVALFGETKQIKDQLKELGGRFNRNLKWQDQTKPGWIFSKSKKEALEQLLSGDLPDTNQREFSIVMINTGNLNTATLQSLGGTFNPKISYGGRKVSGWLFPLQKLDELRNAENLPDSEYVPPVPLVDSENEPLKLVEYSEKSVVLFGNTKPYIEDMKKLGGRFNRYLKFKETSESPEVKKPGWIFSKKKEEDVKKFVEEHTN